MYNIIPKGGHPYKDNTIITMLTMSKKRTFLYKWPPSWHIFEFHRPALVSMYNVDKFMTYSMKLRISSNPQSENKTTMG